MNIKILQAFTLDTSNPTWYPRYVELSKLINSEYSKSNGYDYHFSSIERKFVRRPHWAKLQAIKYQLDRDNIDYILYLDSDAFFYSHDIRIESLFDYWPKKEEQCIMATIDVQEEGRRFNSTYANTGVILIKNCDMSRKIIKYWNAHKDDHKYNIDDTLADQSAFNEEILPLFSDQINLVKDYYLMNGRYGQFIRHINGCYGGDILREIEMRRFSEQRNIK